MKKTTTIYMFLLCSLLGFSQERQITKADKNYDKYSFIKAIDIYERVAEKGFKSEEIFKKLGNAYYFNADYDNAAKWYGELHKLKDTEIESEYYFRYAQSLKAIKKYSEADAMMQKFRDSKTSDKRAELFSEQPEYLEYIKFQSGRYQIENFPANSEYSDFAPSFYERSLVFSSARDTGTFARFKHSWNDQPFLDLYGGPLDSDGPVQGIRKFSKELNSKYHESTTAFTKDGRTVYFTRNNSVGRKIKRDSLGVNKLKIYRATIVNGVWRDITELPFNGDDFSTAHPALSPDGRRLFFASDREGSLGQSDLYMVTINVDGTYGEPQNLGSSVNTEGRETFPFVSDRGNLYFASDGHPGLGGLDVFVVRADANSNGQFDVVNIGEPVNSSSDDFTFIINDGTGEGFFASNREGGVGSDDIYRLTEIAPVKNECRQKVKGTVTDRDTSEPLARVEVLVIDEENKIIERSVTDDTGIYIVTLDCTRDHFIRAVKPGYSTQETLVEATFEEEELTINFELEKDEVTADVGDDLAKILDLKPIYFSLNRSRIRDDAKIELAKVIAAMEKYPQLKIDVRSHTDSRASDDYNLRLSERRAKATVDYLVKNGIDLSRITGKGYGETQLVNECGNGVQCSSAQHQLNRRSEFVIIQ
ncbi:OmpA family protein [Leptobacterium flavescens]|uniref:OmpA family protein n=1 Tax=Leptobacterium flavescens TaxID=472055 RepID=A0A6P0UH10_9FLAO|nr:OmpA family protein [Leptobacterium flavescens]NER12297.1 OmpA family protein [Leptobacterium flavescens]